MNREQVINLLVASGTYNEDERAILNKMDDAKLQTLASCYADDDERTEDTVPGHEAGRKKKSVMVPPSGGMKSGMPFAANDEADQTNNEGEGKTHSCPCANGATCPLTANGAMTVEQYINAAPVEFREVLNSSFQNLRNEKAVAIKTILANAENPFSQQELEKFHLNHLKRLANMAKPKQVQNEGIPNPLFFGQSGAPITDNAAGDTEPLIAPVLNYGKR